MRQNKVLTTITCRRPSSFRGVDRCTKTGQSHIFTANDHESLQLIVNSLVLVVALVLLVIMSDSKSSSEASSSRSATDYIQNAQFQRAEAPATDSPVTSTDLLMAVYDPSKLHPLAEIGDKLDYLLLDDEKTNELPGAGTAIPSRGWSDDLCYGTGTMYLGGKCDLFQITLLEFGWFRFGPRLFPALTLTLSQSLARPHL